MSDRDDPTVRWAEAVVRLEALKVQMEELADRVWLDTFGPRA